jgi:uncharacterized protein (TIGR02391 family)
LHKKVLQEAGKLYDDQHYPEAVNRAIRAVNNAVEAKSRVKGTDGVNLFNVAFSSAKPILKLSDNKEERVAYLQLFNAAWGTIRNPLSHPPDGLTMTADEAFEWIVFCSALMRLVDRAELVPSAT